MILQPPISTLFPYTTLFRSREGPRLATSQFSRILDLDLITDDGNCLYGLVQTREKTNRAAHTARRAPCAYRDRKSTRLNSSHTVISYAVFCLKKKKK